MTNTAHACRRPRSVPTSPIALVFCGSSHNFCCNYTTQPPQPTAPKWNSSGSCGLQGGEDNKARQIFVIGISYQHLMLARLSERGNF